MQNYNHNTVHEEYIYIYKGLNYLNAIFRLLAMKKVHNPISHAVAQNTLVKGQCSFKVGISVTAIDGNHPVRPKPPEPKMPSSVHQKVSGEQLFKVPSCESW